MQSPITDTPLENWEDFGLKLATLYEGAPWNRWGRFRAYYLIVWHLLEGEVTLKDGNSVLHASAGDWVIHQPGLHEQRFTESTRLIAVHLHATCQDAVAVWRGAGMVKLSFDPVLLQHIRRLQASLQPGGYQPHQRLDKFTLKMSLCNWLEMKRAMLGLFQGLLERIEPAGLRLEILRSNDARIRKSMERLLARDLGIMFSRDQLAQECGLSSSQLNRIWIRDFGMTPRQFWDQRRIQWAREQIEHGKLSLKEIGAALGFAHASQFSTWFRLAQHDSPAKYRRLHRVRAGMA